MCAVRWVARISGLMLIAFLGIMVIGHGGLPNFLGQPLAVQLEFLALFTMTAGFLLGWKQEIAGGILATTGFVLFCVVEWLANSQFPGGAIPLFAIPGVLFLVCGIANGNARRCDLTAE